MNELRTVLDSPRCTVLPLLVYSHEYDYRATKPKPPPYQMSAVIPYTSQNSLTVEATLDHLDPIPEEVDYV